MEDTSPSADYYGEVELRIGYADPEVAGHDEQIVNGDVQVHGCCASTEERPDRSYRMCRRYHEDPKNYCECAPPPDDAECPDACEGSAEVSPEGTGAADAQKAIFRTGGFWPHVPADIHPRARSWLKSV